VASQVISKQNGYNGKEDDLISKTPLEEFFFVMTLQLLKDRYFFIQLRACFTTGFQCLANTQYCITIRLLHVYIAFLTSFKILNNNKMKKIYHIDANANFY
jgi:hypothetical protein